MLKDLSICLKDWSSDYKDCFWDKEDRECSFFSQIQSLCCFFYRIGDDSEYDLLDRICHQNWSVSDGNKKLSSTYFQVLSFPTKSRLFISLWLSRIQSWFPEHHLDFPNTILISQQKFLNIQLVDSIIWTSWKLNCCIHLSNSKQTFLPWDLN